MKFLAHALISFLLWIDGSSVAHADSVSFQIVVHPSNTLTSVDQKFLADVFLKKKTYWDDKKVIVVADLWSSSRVRREFSEKILDRPVSAVRNYWQQLLFSGRGIPPPEFKSETEMLNFIATHEDAIGYVSVGTELRNLKVLKIE